MKRHALYDDGNEHVRCYGASDLGAHSIFRSTEERLDAKVLLDPFEK